MLFFLKALTYRGKGTRVKGFRGSVFNEYEIHAQLFIDEYRRCNVISVEIV